MAADCTIWIINVRLRAISELYVIWLVFECKINHCWCHLLIPHPHRYRSKLYYYLSLRRVLVSEANDVQTFFEWAKRHRQTYWRISLRLVRHVAILLGSCVLPWTSGCVWHDVQTQAPHLDWRFLSGGEPLCALGLEGLLPEQHPLNIWSIKTRATRSQ